MGGKSNLKAIFKILARFEWQAAQDAGVFTGSAVDIADGYIHFSTAEQMVETAAKHFAGQADLILLTIAIDRLDRDLVWEPSRGGNLFPHLYAPLPLNAVVRVDPLPLAEDGRHIFPHDLTEGA